MAKEKSTSMPENWNLVEVGRSTRFLINFNGYTMTFSELLNMTDLLSTLFRHCDNGEVYLDAGELELGGSRLLNQVSEKLQRLLTCFQSYPTPRTHYRLCPVSVTKEKSTSTP
jgi:hypothetical protein